MLDFLKLNKEVSETTADIEPDDVLSVKKKLKNLGHYKEPEWGLTNFSDNQMFAAIRNFQKEKGLKVDGVIKPEGETENKINEILSKQNENSSILSGKVDRDKVIKDRIYPVIKQHEENIIYPYKDTKGNITVGLGSNVNNKQKFDSVKWQDQAGNPISKEDAERYYQKLLALPHGNYKASKYKNDTPLRISDQESHRLYEDHIKEDLDYLRKTFKNFDKFPPQLQDVLIDIKYNTGNVEASEWKYLHQGIAKKSLSEIIQHVNRHSVPRERNIWAKDRIREIKKLDY